MGDEGEIFVRRAEFDDQPHINELVGEEAHVTARRFGDYNVATMIEQASLGITAVDDKDAVVGYAAFFDFPYLKNISQQDWPSWLHSAYGNAELTPANTAWLSFFIADPLCQTEVAENILRTAFTTLPEVDALLLALPADVRPFAPLRDTFEQLPAAEHATATGGVDETDTPPPEAEYNVYVCPRGLYLPELLVREARVEDHDDLVPVFDSQSEVLSERYGEFFIAELIASQALACARSCAEPRRSLNARFGDLERASTPVAASESSGSRIGAGSRSR